MNSSNTPIETPLYRTLLVTRPCNLCQEPFESALQFRTGLNQRQDQLQTYRVEEPLSREEAMDIPNQTLFQAIGEGFCPPCRRVLKIHEFKGLVHCLRQCIASGTLVLKQGRWFPKTLDTLSLETLAHKKLLVLETTHTPFHPFDLLNECTSIDWHGQDAKQGTPPYAQLLENLNHGIRQYFLQMGLPTGPRLRDDLWVKLIPLEGGSTFQWTVESRPNVLTSHEGGPLHP